MTHPTPKPPANNAVRALSVDGFTLIVVAALAWYGLLFTGYDLGQLVHGAKVLASDTVAPDDLGRTMAHSGIAVLTDIPVRLGGLAGVLGCIGLILRKDWAMFPLIAAALLLIWPVLVWIVSSVFWSAIDSEGALLLIVHIVITVTVAVGLPVLARFGSRRGRKFSSTLRRSCQPCARTSSRPSIRMS